MGEVQGEGTKLQPIRDILGRSKRWGFYSVSTNEGDEGRMGHIVNGTLRIRGFPKGRSKPGVVQIEIGRELAGTRGRY